MARKVDTLHKMGDAISLAFELEKGLECLEALPSGLRTASDASQKALKRLSHGWKIGA